MGRYIKYAGKIIFSRTLIIILMILLQAAVLLSAFFWLGKYMSFIFEGMTVLGAVLIIYIINRDEPTEFKLAWIIPVCIFPVLGALFYLFTVSNAGGVGLALKVGRRLKETKDILRTDEKTQEEINACSDNFRGFAHYMEHTGGFPAYRNTKAVYFPLGEDKYRDMLSELERAEKFIFMEYFIIERGVMWDSVLEILKRKAAEGVEVRVMYDGMCTIFKLPYGYQKKLAEYGIRAKLFAPLMPFLSTNQNNRDHRKILVIDGRVAYTGGINLADEYINAKNIYGHWKDTAVKVEGDAVKSFTLMFLQMWNVSDKKAVHTREDYTRYFADGTDAPDPAGQGYVIPYGETPTMHQEISKTVYETMIVRADRYVHIMTPYFIVEREFLDSMCYAAKRGVDISLVLPYVPDKKLIYYIGRTYYPKLLQAGINIYEYLPGFIHAKVMVSDDSCATVGSVNLDYRSYYHNFECGAFFYGGEVIKSIEKDFGDTIELCRRVDMDSYRRIPFWQKAIGLTFKLFAPLL